MLKVTVGYIRINAIDVEEIREIVNASTSTIEEDNDDYILVGDADPYMIDKLFKDGYIDEEDYFAAPECDLLRFYAD